MKISISLQIKDQCSKQSYQHNNYSRRLTKGCIVSTDPGEPPPKDSINEGFSPGAIFADEAYFRIPKR